MVLGLLLLKVFASKKPTREEKSKQRWKKGAAAVYCIRRSLCPLMVAVVCQQQIATPDNK